MIINLVPFKMDTAIVCQVNEIDGKKSKPCQYSVTFNQYYLRQ